MRILIADFYPKKAHKYFNCMYISAFAKFAKVTVVSVNGYYEAERDFLFKEGVQIKDLDVKEKNGRLGTRLFCIAIQNKIKKYIKAFRQDYDLIFCLSYDTIAMAFAKKIINIIPTILCQHSNIDEYANKIKFLFAHKYINKVYHCVLEEQFKNYLVEKIGIIESRVFFVPHPITLNDDGIKEEVRYDCVGLCNANSDVIINDMVSNSNSYEQKGISLLIRSKTITSESPNIKIINEYLDRQQYMKYLKQAKFIFVATPPGYIYRLSGSIYDAFTLHKMVITTNTFYPDLYKDIYPGICYGVKDEREFFEKLLFLEKYDIEQHDNIFRKFILDHSMDNIVSQINNMINTICDYENRLKLNNVKVKNDNN